MTIEQLLYKLKMIEAEAKKKFGPELLEVTFDLASDGSGQIKVYHDYGDQEHDTKASAHWNDISGLADALNTVFAGVVTHG